MPQHDVGPVEQLDGESVGRQIEVDGRPILLLRDGDDLRAVSATCPHAGAKLAHGVRDGGRIICPWHKASFCIRTGAWLEPPAVDDLQSYGTRVERGRIIVTTPSVTRPPPTKHGGGRNCVIIGGGAAGAVAAQSLRELGFGGRVVILDRENRVPYDRTVLSKYFLSGQQGAEKSPLQTQSWYVAHDIERHTAEVVHIDPQARRITCADGSVWPYDAALIATGGVPRRPDLPGADLAGVHVLRSRADAEAILARAERSRRAVIVGAGFIGMEIAASLRERGLDVTVVAPENTPFEKQLGARIGGALMALHERHGVRFHLGEQVAALEGESDVRAAVLKSGETLMADLVVFGSGIRPASFAIAGVALDEDGGIPVDAELRVADGLYAAGDVARFPLRGDGPGIRVEHWRVAQQHGRIAARNIAGQKAIYDAVPVFWTIQYLKRLDYIGHATDWDEVAVHGDLGKPQFLAYYIRNGKVIAAAGMDRDQDMAALIALFTPRRQWTDAELGDTPRSVLGR